MKENRIHIEVVPRAEPDIGLYVQALVALARQTRAADAPQASAESGEAATDTAPDGGVA